jgi:hypothetical protein
MAALAGLLGAFAGAGIARSRRGGAGLGFRIVRARHAGAEGGLGRRLDEGQAYSTERATERYAPAPTRAEETTREVTRTEGPGAPGDPYHH